VLIDTNHHIYDAISYLSTPDSFMQRISAMSAQAICPIRRELVEDTQRLFESF